MARRSSLAGNGDAAAATPRPVSRQESPRSSGVYLTPRPGADTVWDLQTRASSHCPSGEVRGGYDVASRFSTCLSPFDGRSSVGIRCGSECDPCLAGPCQPGDDESLCRNYATDEGGSTPSVRPVHGDF